MLILKDLKYDMWVDGMGKTVNRMYMEQPEYVRNEKALGRQEAVQRGAQSRGPGKGPREAQVIVTTGGMLDGGPVLRYLQEVKNDPKSAVLMTGYQVDGSNGSG